MQMEETFDFGKGPETYHFDHSDRSPVNGEARIEKIENLDNERPFFYNNFVGF